MLAHVHYGRTSKALALAAATVCMLAACSSSGGGGGTPSTTGSSESTPVGATSDTNSPLGTPNKATGTPVKLGWANLEGGSGASYPERTKAAEAAVAYANDYLGGLAGHVIQLDECKDLGDGASATACANKFVDDKVVAVVEGQVADDTGYVTTLGKAGIPWTALTGVSAQAFTASNSFLWTPAVLGEIGAVVKYASDHQLSSVDFMGDNVAGVTSVYNSFVKPMFDKAGVKVNLTLVPPAEPDPTPQVIAALGTKPGAIVMFLDVALYGSVIPIIAANPPSSGDKPVLFGTPTALDPSVLKKVSADDLDGLQIPAYLGRNGKDDPETQLYDAVMAKYASSTDPGGDAPQGYGSLLALVRLVNAAAPTGDLTAASITTALHSAKDIPMPLGLGAKLTCDGTALAAFPAVCSPQSVTAVMSGSTVSSFSLADVSSVVNAAFPGQ